MISFKPMLKRIFCRSDLPQSGLNSPYIESNSSDGLAGKHEKINSVPANRQSLLPKELGKQILKIILSANNKGDILENIEGCLNYCKTGVGIYSMPVKK